MSEPPAPESKKPRPPRKRVSTSAAAAASESRDGGDRKAAAAARDSAAHDATPAAAASPVPLIRVPMHVRWRDLDAFSHVNNSSFLTYIEEARLQWFQSLPGPWLSEESAPVLAATHVNYRRPIEWPCELDVELHVERLGNTSLTLGHRIVGRDDGVLYSDGYSVLVWIDRRDGATSPLPPAVRAACG